mmetsp:Transcript_76643/g.151628  ORF Transcript_76643/g.151628 Transcript_76643/m.151628 type:complete len:783 (+) Transcript_76643:94-2442(+)
MAGETESLLNVAPDGKRQRVRTLLNAYYRIETCQQEPSDVNGELNDLIASVHFPGLLEKQQELAAEVRKLEGGVQTQVVDNYMTVLQAVNVTNHMKSSLDHGLVGLKNNIEELNSHQCPAVDELSDLGQQIEILLKQQHMCKKLQVLFDLPTTLQRCLDSGKFAEAIQACHCCGPFLQKHKNNPTFSNILEDVDKQSGRIRSALGSHLMLPESTVEQAVKNSEMLLDLGEDWHVVATTYLKGRAAMLQQSQDRCFMMFVEFPEVVVNGQNRIAGAESLQVSPDQVEFEFAESKRFRAAWKSVSELFVPQLCSVIEGFQQVRHFRRASSDGEAITSTIDETILLDFVKLHVRRVCDLLSELVANRHPPTQELVSCIHFLRDSMKPRLHALVPELLTALFTDFMSQMARCAMKTVFQEAAAHLIVDLCCLHDKCKHLEESKDCVLDQGMEEIARTEQSVLMHVVEALNDCEPLLRLVSSDLTSWQQLTQEMHEQLIAFFSAFVHTCHAYIGQEPLFAWNFATPLPFADGGSVSMQLSKAASLDWNGLFGLALVRIGRHFQVKTIDKVWTVANMILDDGEIIDCSPKPPPPCLKENTGVAAKAIMKHYVMMSGQHVAHVFRNSVQNRNWMTTQEPHNPRQVVARVVEEVQAFSEQLSRILGDTRKLNVGHQSQRLTRYRDGEKMEQLEQLFVKRQPVFDHVPCNRNAAVVSIVHIAFKALNEYMRDETFSKFGLQQVQMDCAFLRKVIGDIVATEDASMLCYLLDEVLSSASQRCNDLQTMHVQS